MREICLSVCICERNCTESEILLGLRCERENGGGVCERVVVVVVVVVMLVFVREREQWYSTVGV